MPNPLPPRGYRAVSFFQAKGFSFPWGFLFNVYSVKPEILYERPSTLRRFFSKSIEKFLKTACLLQSCTPCCLLTESVKMLLQSSRAAHIPYSFWRRDAKKAASHIDLPLFDEKQTYSVTLAGLTRMPGPMVEATTQLLIYWPLAAAGFALTTAPSSVLKLSSSFSGPKDTLPMGQ